MCENVPDIINITNDKGGIYGCGFSTNKKDENRAMMMLLTSLYVNITKKY